MSDRILLDTNVLVRFLLGDDPTLTDDARRLFEQSDRGERRLVLLPVVLAETVFVLESFYKVPRRRIAEILGRLIVSSGIEAVDGDEQALALRLYSERKTHFVDCLLAAAAERRQLAVASFDNDLRRFPGIVCVRPGR